MTVDTDVPFRGITSQQRDFILTITNALAEYSPESTGQSGVTSPLAGDTKHPMDGTLENVTFLK